MLIIVSLYLALFLGVFFTSKDIDTTVVLSLNLGLYILLLIIYLVTVIFLSRKFNYLPDLVKTSEI